MAEKEQEPLLIDSPVGAEPLVQRLGIVLSRGALCGWTRLPIHAVIGG